MTLDNTTLWLLAAPATMSIVALATIWRPGKHAVVLDRLSTGVGAFGVYLAAIGLALLVNHGPMQSAPLGWLAVSFSVAITPLTMIGLVVTAGLALYLFRFCRARIADGAYRDAVTGRVGAAAAALQLAMLTGSVGLFVVAGGLSGLVVYDVMRLERTRRAPRPRLAAALLGLYRGV
jgi:hypothetical protein